MRKATALLAATSLVLAASTAYLAFQLRSAREELAAARATPASGLPERAAASETRPLAPDSPTTAPLAASAQQPAQPAGPGKKEMEAGARAGQFQASAYLRKVLNDPEKRAKMERDTRQNLEKELSQFIRSLDLTEDERLRLLDMLTGHQMGYADTVSRCAETPGCDVSAIGAAQIQGYRRELTDLLGAEKAQRFADYRDNAMERNTVAGFRAELPDSLQLSDAQAEQLANALGDERRRVTREWEQRGVGVASTGNMFGFIYHPNNVQNNVERVAEASEFQRRQRERAAEVLTAGQLEAFTERQEDILDVARNGWETEERTRDSNPN